MYIDDCASASSVRLFCDGMSSQASWGDVLVHTSGLDKRAAVEILRVLDRVPLSLPYLVRHLPPDRGQSFWLL